MQQHSPYDFAVIRIVPRVEREEFVNAGVVVFCPARKFLKAKVLIDEPRLQRFGPRSTYPCSASTSNLSRTSAPEPPTPAPSPRARCESASIGSSRPEVR